MSREPTRTLDARTLPHRSEPRPVHFAVEEFVPESVIHLIVRTFLYQLLEFILKGRAFVGSDQFVYFDGANPKRCVAPDVYVVPNSTAGTDVTSWKTWERGTPSLCIEIDNSALPEHRWDDKLAHYRSMGVYELVYFAPEASPGERLRVWDRIDDDLIERVIENDSTPCTTLGLQWVVRAIDGAQCALRLADDETGERLVLDRAETERRARELNERALERAEREREEGLARIAALEEELRRRSGGQG